MRMEFESGLALFWNGAAKLSWLTLEGVACNWGEVNCG